MLKCNVMTVCHSHPGGSGGGVGGGGICGCIGGGIVSGSSEGELPNGGLGGGGECTVESSWRSANISPIAVQTIATTATIMHIQGLFLSTNDTSNSKNESPRRLGCFTSNSNFCFVGPSSSLSLVWGASCVKVHRWCVTGGGGIDDALYLIEALTPIPYLWVWTPRKGCDCNPHTRHARDAAQRDKKNTYTPNVYSRKLRLLSESESA